MTSLFVRIQLFLMNLRDEERGQDLVEYALFTGLIAAGIVALGIAYFQGWVGDMVDNVGQCIDFDGTTVCNPGW